MPNTLTHATLGVLAAAYRTNAPAALLTHVATLDGDEMPTAVLCKRVKLDNLVDLGAYSDEELAAPATCPVCASRDPR